MSEGITVTFHGVRGSYPCPDPRLMRVGGNTACVEVRAGGHLIVLDAGTGIINLGKKLMQESAAGNNGASPTPLIINLFFTHTHHDHTQGFPFFLPAYRCTSTLYIFVPRILQEDLRLELSHAMISPAVPVHPDDLHSHPVMHTVDKTETNVLWNYSHTP